MTYMKKCRQEIAAALGRHLITPAQANNLREIAAATDESEKCKKERHKTERSARRSHD